MPRTGPPPTEVVILAGGAGTRLWPASDESTPKQFLSLPGEETLIEQAAKRAAKLVPEERIWIVTLAGLVSTTREILKGFPPDRIIAEPKGRNSGPASAVATFHIQAVRGEPSTILVIPADHFIPDAKKFAKAMGIGFKRAADGESIVTFGLKPTMARSDYGYIEASPKRLGRKIVKALKFIEKPPIAKAQKFLKAKRFYWNSGIFCWRSDFFLSQLENSSPEIHRPLKLLDWKSPYIGDQLSHVYSELPNISIDFAVMEKCRSIDVVPSDFAWSDLGNWAAVHEALTKDRDGNAIVGPGRIVEGSGNLVFAKGKPVYLFGTEDLVVVDTEDATLVTTREKSRDLKKYLAKLSR